MTGRCVSCDPTDWVRGSVQEAVEQVQSVDLWCDWYPLPAEACVDVPLFPLVCAGPLATWLSPECSRPPSSSCASCDVGLVSGQPGDSGGRVQCHTLCVCEEVHTTVMVGGEEVLLVGGEEVQLVGGEAVLLVGGEAVLLVGGELVLLVGGEVVLLAGGEVELLTGHMADKRWCPVECDLHVHTYILCKCEGVQHVS